ncbi:hypothetical protein [Streptomyces sp. V3I7]|uniref:DUF6907 domain-containing protein n=1 Tax=Streptomyces sp. V3I7 TaxID=3042278 RepID=UPI00277D6557|nr:hypothetical protein [Streptomyces sp. V3I7]MDQ0992187.1 hypothetical protein [Streptomyces sp. V3I7]
MSTEPRSATVHLLVTKSLEIDEPDWCVGHHDDLAQFKPDITHYGPEHTITGPDGVVLFRAMLGQSPFAEIASRDTDLYVEAGDFTGSYTPAEVDQLADALTESAVRLRALGRHLARILDGGGQ